MFDFYIFALHTYPG